MGTERGEYELDLKMCGISTERFREIFILRMGFDQDPDFMDISVKVSEDRSLLVGTLINGRWVDIKGTLIFKFLSNPKFTGDEIGNIIHYLKYVDEIDIEAGDTDDE